MRGTLVETLIGAIVLAVAAGFLYVAYQSAKFGPTDGYEVNAAFDSASGVTVGSDVRVSGIKIGSVTAQKLDPDSYQAIVTLSVDSSVQLPEDTSAKIALDGLLGGSYISLSPGGSPDMLEDGGIIEYTQGSIDLMGLIGKFIYGSAESDAAPADDPKGNFAP